MKKIFIFSTVHPWNDIRIFHKESKSLAKRYDIELHIPANFKHKQIGNIHIFGLQKWDRRIDRIKAILTVTIRALKSKADIYHFHDPELIPVGFILRIFRKKVIYDVHEDYPKAILSKTWLPKPIRIPIAKVMHFLEWLAARFFLIKIIIAWPRIADHFPDNKTKLVQNFSITSELLSETPCPYNKRPNNLVYVGSISKIRGIYENIKSFEYIKTEDFRMKLIGTFNDSLIEKECKNLANWARIDFLGWKDRNEVRDILDKSKIGIILFQAHPNHMNAHPNKLFEYMSAGIPVVISNFPLWKNIVDDARCGLTVDPTNIKEIADAINWLFENPEEAEQMGQNGRTAVLEKYNWEQEELKLFQIYEDIIS